MSGKPKNLQNQKFDQLTVVCPAGKDKNGNARWRCRCDCGEYITISAPALKANRPHSCLSCKMKSLWEKRDTHKESATRLYSIYYNMRKRCENPNAINYHNYGGRGISVCDEWKKYEAFSTWAHANGYTDELSIDRIDNDSGYCPDNCRWVTYTQQANNTRANRWIDFNGETRTLAEWASIIGINRSTLCERLNRMGWSIEQALTTSKRT